MSTSLLSLPTKLTVINKNVPQFIDNLEKMCLQFSNDQKNIKILLMNRIRNNTLRLHTVKRLRSNKKLINFKKNGLKPYYNSRKEYLEHKKQMLQYLRIQKKMDLSYILN